MNVEFVVKKLRHEGIELDLSTLKLLESQGFMSEVYRAESSVGPIVLHWSTTTAEQARQKVWDKVYLVGELIVNRNLPVSRVLFHEAFDDVHLVVQSELPGFPGGRRYITTDNLVADEWFVTNELVNKEIEEAIANIHEIKLVGAGWVKNIDGKPSGGYKNWKEFLEEESKLWLKSIQSYKDKVFLDALTKATEVSLLKIKSNYNSLLHGDIVNPSNILISDDHISGIVDWEWALVGDPAWEFCFLNKYKLDNYFKRRKLTKKEQTDFWNRAKNYEILFLLWAIHTHITNTNSKLDNYIWNHINIYLKYNE